MPEIDFSAAFEKLTGNPPFPWQQAMYRHMLAGEWDALATCSLPTGLGKTNTIAVWLIALANNPTAVPRRLVYVVNRRTAVDQTTDVAKDLWKNAEAASVPVPAISTLRGQFADNREWSADPSRPAIISGTVDMIGSRLLFSGYGIGFKSKPLHAGFLAQDALLIHDEAHLEPAFQKLIEAIQTEQKRCKDFGQFHVIELSATSRGERESFKLGTEDHKNALVKQRIEAKKSLEFHSNSDPKKLADEIAKLAVKHEDSGRAVLVFVQKVEDVEAIVKKLPKGRVAKLTGTLRGKERDELVDTPVFQRFLPGKGDGTETVYLVCTSAGEVGVNISADNLICDLTTFDSMAQRFGRVNRFGERDDTRVDVVYPTEFKDDDLDARRELTLKLLKDGKLDGNASPKSLGSIPEDERRNAFAPTPEMLETSEILFDAWALTSVREKLPGRPYVEPYLHGVTNDLPETHVAWRSEVEKLRLEFEDDDTAATRLKKRRTFEKFAAELLEDYPLKPHELLREPSHRAFKHLVTLADRDSKLPAWLLDDEGGVQVLTLGALADKDRKDQIKNKTVLLPPSAGGLLGGQLDGSEKYDESRNDYDVADEWQGPNGEAMRERNWDIDKPPPGWRMVRSVPIGQNDDGEPRKVWRWLVRLKATDEAGAVGQPQPYPLGDHNCDAGEIASGIAERLNLAKNFSAAVAVAAANHDLGKDREIWQ